MSTVTTKRRAAVGTMTEAIARRGDMGVDGRRVVLPLVAPDAEPTAALSTADTKGKGAPAPDSASRRALRARLGERVAAARAALDALDALVADPASSNAALLVATGEVARSLRQMCG